MWYHAALGFLELFSSSQIGDLNGDALYNQYRDQFMRQGKLAAADTVGQVSALTGGY